MSLFRVPLSISLPVRMTEAEVDAFARRTGWIDDVGVISADRTIVQIEDLPWWPGRRLILARDPDWGNVFAAWMQDDNLHRLDGTSPPIHAMNAQVNAGITAEYVLPYLGFFCTFVHGPEGPFAIVCSPQDQILPPGLDREDIAQFLRPPTLLKSDDAGHHVEAIVCYARMLFLANFIVSPTGMCSMIHDEPLVEIDHKIEMSLRFSK